MADIHPDGIKSTAAIGKHPLHPMIVPIPITLLPGALVTDIVYFATRDPLWAQMSYWFILVGLVSGLLAGILGAIDFLTIQRAKKSRAGRIHAIGNIIALLLAALNLILRLGDPIMIPIIGMILSGLTAILLAVTGWFGGQLTYYYMIGVTGHKAREGSKPPS